MKKIDISSTILEKDIDIAKGFLEKLNAPSAKELGLIFKNGVAKLRFKNQIQPLIKTRHFVKNTTSFQRLFLLNYYIHY